MGRVIEPVQEKLGGAGDSTSFRLYGGGAQYGPSLAKAIWHRLLLTSRGEPCVAKDHERLRGSREKVEKGGNEEKK